MAMETIRRSPSAGWSSSEGAEDAAGILHLHFGPLLRELASQPAADLAGYRAAGGYRLAAEVAAAETPEPYLVELDRAGVRGRGGGGYPVGHKWYLLARKTEETRFLVCNAHAREGDRRVAHLLAAAPHKLLEAVAVAALLTGAERAILAVPGSRPDLVEMLRAVLGEATAAGLLGGRAFGSGRRLEVTLFETPDSHVVGEETALLEAIDGRRVAPRGKAPLPVTHGLQGHPTAVSNVESVLQAFLALRAGAERFRSVGTPAAPGTMLFTLRGDVVRPGLYELPLGTTLRALIYDHGGGVRGGPFRCVFPGGLTTPPVGEASLDLPLDFDSLRDAGSDLGAGEVTVVAREVAAPVLAAELARAFHEASCGKCRPCRDGTERTLTMLEKLERIGEKSIDLSGRAIPGPRRRYALRILGQSDPTAPSGISYTDMTSGVDKIVHLCEFFRHRGDCHHSLAAGSVLLRVVELFRDEFEAAAAAPAGDAAAGAVVQPA